jgi:G3E family GTPase
MLVEVSKLARERRFDYLLVESTGTSEPLPVAEPRLGRLFESSPKTSERQIAAMVSGSES